jgi:hypothetical protein
MFKRKGVVSMKAATKKIDPESFILSVLSPEDRLEAAFTIAQQAFRKSDLTVKDINRAVESVRSRSYDKKKGSS